MAWSSSSSLRARFRAWYSRSSSLRRVLVPGGGPARRRLRAAAPAPRHQHQHPGAEDEREVGQEPRQAVEAGVDRHDERRLAGEALQVVLDDLLLRLPLVEQAGDGGALL